jgi:hypothetical protein
MMRGRKSRSIVLGSLAIVALAATAPGAGAAEPAAVEEYVLTLPGVRTVGVSDPEAGEEAEPIAAVGVTGERRDSGSALGAVGSAAATPAGVAVLVALLAALALSTGRRRIRR